MPPWQVRGWFGSHLVDTFCTGRPGLADERLSGLGAAQESLDHAYGTRLPFSHSYVNARKYGRKHTLLLNVSIISYHPSDTVVAMRALPVYFVAR